MPLSNTPNGDGFEGTEVASNSTMPDPTFGHPPMFGHLKYLVHFLSARYQIQHTLSSTMYEHSPGVF